MGQTPGSVLEIIRFCNATFRSVFLRLALYLIQLDRIYKSKVITMIFNYLSVARRLTVQYGLLVVLCMTLSVNIVAEEKQSLTKKTGSDLPLLEHLLDLGGKKDCQLRGYTAPYNKPPFNRHKYNQCVKKSGTCKI